MEKWNLEISKIKKLGNNKPEIWKGKLQQVMNTETKKIEIVNW